MVYEKERFNPNAQADEMLTKTNRPKHIFLPHRYAGMTQLHKFYKIFYQSNEPNSLLIYFRRNIWLKRQFIVLHGVLSHY